VRKRLLTLTLFFTFRYIRKLNGNHCPAPFEESDIVKYHESRGVEADHSPGTLRTLLKYHKLPSLIDFYFYP